MYSYMYVQTYACTDLCMWYTTYRTYICGILHTGLALGRIGLDPDFLQVNTS